MRSPNGVLLDTNVLSEVNKPRPHAKVLRFLEGLSSAETYVSALTFGELRKGVAVRQRRNVGGAPELAAWVDGLEERYANRILPVNLQIARIWGELSAGRSLPIVDTLLAATAIHHGLVLVTRNVRNVQATPAAVHNPWSD